MLGSLFVSRVLSYGVQAWVFLLLRSPWLRVWVGMTIMTSTGRLCPYIRSALDGPHQARRTYYLVPMWRPSSVAAILEGNGSWSTRVTSREYLRTKESVAGNLGTTTGHAILGEHMWASDKALGAEGTGRQSNVLSCKDDSKGQCDDLWLEDSMRPRGLREARSTVEQYQKTQCLIRAFMDV
jgi:hypothetical protein